MYTIYNNVNMIFYLFHFLQVHKIYRKGNRALDGCSTVQNTLNINTPIHLVND